MPTDASGRSVDRAAAPRRVVSLVPSLTEYLFAIGAGERVVGVTDYCSEPAHQLTGVARVRGTKNPHRAHIQALQPDLVLAAKEENRERDIAALTAMGIPVYVTDITSVAGAVEQLDALARLVEATQRAAPLLDPLRVLIEQHRTGRVAQPGKRTLAFIWRDPWMVIGGDTYADDLLQICGADNLARQLPGRYPRAALADFMGLDPDIILLPDEPYPFSAADVEAFQSFGNVTAVRTQRIYLCSGMLLTWYGSYMLEAVRRFTALFSD